MNVEKQLYLFSSCETCELIDIVGETDRLIKGVERGIFFYLGLRVPGYELSLNSDILVLTNHPHQAPISYCSKERCVNNAVIQRASHSRVPLLLSPCDLATLASSIFPANIRPLSSGLIAPVHGPEDELAFFVVLGGWRWSPEVLDDLDVRSLQLLAFKVHATVVECALKPEHICTVTLTDREKECLLLTARGKTAWEISKILGRSRGTVNFHLQNAMRKLDSVNKTQAAAKAIETRLIH